ncbi:helix-turn-helix transcriptional regulator [Plantactinospora sonchi]|uniref:YafY family protein n=1 Tax=Plantactinospora sonchi TaxID=1544735 RepID=A0ABU7RS40_9ACTN
MRAARLISLVLLLQNRGSMTGAELARELEISERTVHRDVLALNAAGIPVYADRGRAGGYRLLGGYRTRLTGLSRDEADALFLSGLPGPAGDMGLTEVVAAARLKVLAALPSGLRDASSRVERRFHLDVPGWFRETTPPPWLTELAGAVWQDRTVELRYRRRDREEVTRTVEPYGLVLKGGQWYLVARIGADHRTYRVDRIVDVAVEPTTFARDDSFDLVGYWTERAEQFVRALLADEITVRLSPAGLRALRRVTEPPAVRDAVRDAGEPDAQGWVVTRLPVESPDVAYGQLLSLGPEVEVLAPPELRARLADAARRLTALYEV